MDFETEIARIHSKENAQKIASYTLAHPDSFEELFSLLFHKDNRIVQRASWPLGMLGKKKPEWFLPHFDQIMLFLKKPPHDAVSRNLYRILQDITTPQSYCGTLFSLCIRDLNNTKTPVAIKAFAMTVAFNISKTYPELQPELKLTIEENRENQSAGYHSRARTILAKLG